MGSAMRATRSLDSGPWLQKPEVTSTARSTTRSGSPSTEFSSSVQVRAGLWLYHSTSQARKGRLPASSSFRSINASH